MEKSFMGVPMEELTPHIDAYKKMMADLDHTSLEEKIESLKDHLVIIPFLIKYNNWKALEACKLGMIKILASI